MHNRIGESIARFSSGWSQVESYKRHSRLAAAAHRPATGWRIRVENPCTEDGHDPRNSPPDFADLTNVAGRSMAGRSSSVITFPHPMGLNTVKAALALNPKPAFGFTSAADPKI